MTTSTHIALIALLWSRCGRGLIAASDVAICAASLPNGAHVDVASLTHDLVSARLLVRSAERAWTISPQAIESISLPDQFEVSLSPEEEHQLFAALQQSSRGGSLARADLHAVTRRFLEDVLNGAMIPDELLDRIVSAYGARGRLNMSEDGRRYTIRMNSEER